jgi:hypothetical protein
MRKALVVGLDYYQHISGLRGAVNDANSVKGMLERHADGSVNFAVKLIVSSDLGSALTRAELKDAVRELFAGDGEVALLYFAGHGHLEVTGGYLCGADCQTGDDGLPLSEVMTLANQSKFQNRVIILDSCHSGIAGADPNLPSITDIADGVTILAASTAEQYASEENGAGIFTGLMVDGLAGAAANLVGDVSPGSVYALVDQSLGPWAQRPVFKTNVKRFVSLRRADPPIELASLHRITEFFPSPGHQFQLDPSFEPERSGKEDQSVPPPNAVNTAIFQILQKYNRLNLLVPVDAPHMWHAAIDSKSCRLTAVGEHYRQLVAKGLV